MLLYLFSRVKSVSSVSSGLSQPCDLVVCHRVDLLQSYKQAVEKRQQAENDLEEQQRSQNTPEMKVKFKECADAELQLAEIEKRLGMRALCVCHVTRQHVSAFSDLSVCLACTFCACMYCFVWGIRASIAASCINVVCMHCIVH